MVSLGPPEKPILKSRYLHLMPEDRALWQKFIYQGEFIPFGVWYDVRVGRGIQVEAGQPEWMKRFVEYSYRKRIDIIGRTGLTFKIIECKPSAGVVALGQVIYYSLAFIEDYKPPGEVIPMIITDKVDQDVKPIFERFGVEVYEVGKVTDEDHQKISQLLSTSVIKKSF